MASRALRLADSGREALAGGGPGSYVARLLGARVNDVGGLHLRLRMFFFEDGFLVLAI